MDYLVVISPCALISRERSIRDIDCQVCIRQASERVIDDGGRRGGPDDESPAGCSLERCFSDGGYAGRQINAGDVRIRESVFTDRGQTGRKCNGGYMRFVERVWPDGGHSGQCSVRERVSSGCIVTNGREIVGLSGPGGKSEDRSCHLADLVGCGKAVLLPDRVCDILNGGFFVKFVGHGLPFLSLIADVVAVQINGCPCTGNHLKDFSVINKDDRFSAQKLPQLLAFQRQRG